MSKCKLIKNYGEFNELVEYQKCNILYTAKEVQNKISDIEKTGKSATIISIQDDNDGEVSYLRTGFRRINNIGYYILEGSFKFKDDYIDM